MRKTRIAAVIGAMFPAIAGATPSVSDNGAMPDQAGLIGALQSINPWPATAYNVATNTAAFTASAAQVMAAQDTVLNLTGVLAAGQALTLPAVADLLAALTPAQAVVGSSVVLRVINSSTGAFAWTVTTNTGWTLAGTMTVAQNTWRDFIVTITGVGANAAAKLQAIGTGTQS